MTSINSGRMKKGILAAFVVALALTLTAEIFAQTNDTGNMETKERIYGSVFPRGEKLPEMFAKYFTGQAYLARLTHDQALNCPVSNVTFEPGCRNNWHSHTGGQLLVAVSGRGYYQAKGEPARELLPGDVVEIGPGVVHWHGAAPDSWFSHLAVETNPQTNRNTWLKPVDDAQYAAATAPAAAVVPQLGAEALRNRAELFSGDASGLGATDPELIEIFDNFAFGEVAGYGDLDTPTRMMCILASCIAAQGQSEFRTMLAGALNAGVTPVEAKEVLYQAVPYVGMAKVLDFVHIANDVLVTRGVALPLEGQSTTSPGTRFERGLAVQKAIFGAGHIDALREAAPEGQKHIQDYLSMNCFGDYVTRGGLDARTRELLTFSMLLTLGGCEPQLKGHIRGNLNLRNDKRTLLTVITQLLPYVGYPRSLNAIACLNEVAPGNE